MLSIIESTNSQKWNTIVRSFNDWDVYYLAEYAASFHLHGDGSPLLIYYRDGLVEICYSVMKKDIANLACFSDIIEENSFFDLATPYGYGGPLVKGEMQQQSLDSFKKELFEFCNDKRIVSQFLRFHPLLDNAKSLDDLCQTRYVHDTIYIDLASSDVIWNNMDSKNRNMIRKAISNDVKIERRPISDITDFIKIYSETMDRDQASEYYYFGDDFFKSLLNLESNGEIFYAIHNSKPISASIILFNNRYMHYHLSGTLTQYRNLGSNNLLLYEAALWGKSKGLHKFHLGGGMANEDSLFSFKKKFNKHGRLPFMIGRTIFDQAGYDYLKQIRSDHDVSFDPNNSFLIQYRK